MVLECAVATNSLYLVMHNISDFQRVSELEVPQSLPHALHFFLKFKAASPSKAR